MGPILTLGEPGDHGPAGIGIQGIGVSTPRAAAVAAATIGLAIDWHIPNGGIFNMGIMSITLAAGAPAITRLMGRTFSEEGATP